MYYQIEYYAGNTIDTQKTFSRRYGKNFTRDRKCGTTPPSMEEQNTKNAERQLTRIINENFKKGDIHLTLTYFREKRPDSENAKKQIQAFLRRLRRYFNRREKELKYLWATAYGSKGAIHHHLVISTMDARDLQSLWPYGRAHAEYCYSAEYSALAAYIVRQAKTGLTSGEKINARRWSGSRNLIIPKPHRKEVSATKWKEPPRAKPGYIIDLNSIDAGINPVTGIPFLFYRQIKIPADLTITTQENIILRGEPAQKYITSEGIKKLQNWKPDGGNLIYISSKK